MFEFLTASPSINCLDSMHCLHCFLNIVNNKTSIAVGDDLRNRAAGECNDGGAAGERFDHNKAEWLGPVDGKEQRRRPTQKFIFLFVTDFPDKFTRRMVEQRF